MSKNKVRQKSIAEKATEEQKVRKRLAEMNLLDDFLFNAMAAYPEIGERFVKILLKIIFGREFKHLSVTAQKVYYGADTNLHGARLDVYLEPEIEEDSDERVTVYNIEPDKRDNTSDKRDLPRRMRFYHAKIAAKSLNAGADYDELKNVIIIMIMPYDPFGLNRMVYTIKSRCIEVAEMPYEDGASTLFLYTKGTEGIPNEALKQLLHYMEHTTEANAISAELQDIQEMVRAVKKDPEVTAGYMLRQLRMMEELNRMRKEVKEEVKEEVREEVKEEVKEEVREEVRAEVKAEARAEVELYNRVSLVCKKLRKGRTLEEIAEDLEEEISVIEPLYNKAKKFAPDYDPNLVFEMMSKDDETDKDDKVDEYLQVKTD
ncbi:MAG: hypothetical protein HFH87_05660 [Lachnospiraceae bacterium]|nr:hypothetical protein [Lachnospiraceae bacterium]